MLDGNAWGAWLAWNVLAIVVWIHWIYIITSKLSATLCNCRVNVKESYRFLIMLFFLLLHSVLGIVHFIYFINGRRSSGNVRGIGHTLGMGPHTIGTKRLEQS